MEWWEIWQDQELAGEIRGGGIRLSARLSRHYGAAPSQRIGQNHGKNRGIIRACIDFRRKRDGAWLAAGRERG